MRLDVARALPDTAPVATVVLDVSRTTESGQHEVELRWRAQREHLEQAGAPEPVLDAVEGVVLAQTGADGPVGRFVVAGSDGRVLLDQLLPEVPARDAASWGPVAHLLPLVRGLDRVVPSVVVELDRTGAEVVVTGPLGEAEAHEVQGDHDVIHKFGGGGWSHLRFQHRVEDSWAHNAAEVAEDLDRVVKRSRPRVVVVTGDSKAVAALQDHLTPRVADLVVDVQAGGPSAGVDEEARSQVVEGALEQTRRAARADLVGRFSQELGRGGAAVEGLAAVVDALRRGQVEELLLRDDPTSTSRLWGGPGALELGTSEQEVRDLGVDQPFEERADALLVRAVVAQDAGISVVGGRFDEDPLAQDPAEDQDEADLPEDVKRDRQVRAAVDAMADGVGALLRYVDPSTPS